MMLRLLLRRCSNSRYSKDFSSISFCVLCFNIDFGFGIEIEGQFIDGRIIPVAAKLGG